MKVTSLPSNSSRRSTRGLRSLPAALLVLSAWSGALGAQTRTTYNDPLANEADSLIAVLLSKKGGIGYGDGVYAFITDQALLKRITRLEGHAMPPLVDCIGDTLTSRTYFDRARPMLRGAVCGQIAEAIAFFRAQPSAQVPRVRYSATAQDLRRAQPVWRAYFDAYAAKRSTLLPAITPSKVGCFSARLSADPKTPNAVDTTRSISFELDTLPRPGTVRPARVSIGPHASVAAPGVWTAFMQQAVEVIWRDWPDSTFLQFVFGRTDIETSSYYMYESKSRGLSLYAPISVTRVACRR